MASYSIIIPAYNEEALLPHSLQAIKEAMRAIDLPGELIVTDNHSSDQTAAVARQHGATVVYEAVNQISRARNTGARAATGQYLIFVDADTKISEDLLRTAIENLQSGKCVGGGALVTFDRETGWMGKWMIRFWMWVSLRYQLAAGSFIYCLHAAFEDVGGFSQAVYAGEEILLTSALKKWGQHHRKHFEIITDFPVLTSARKLDHPARVVLATLICIFFPFSIYFKTLCGYWYKRAATRS